MYSNRDKIVKKGKATATEIEDEVAKALFELENNAKVQAPEDIKKIKLSAAQYLGEGDKKVLHIVIPYPLYSLIKKNHSTIVPYLEGKFKCPVVLTAQRTILSKYGTLHLTTFIEKRKGSQKRPRSRTLTAVHDAFLEDIVMLRPHFFRSTPTK